MSGETVPAGILPLPAEESPADAPAAGDSAPPQTPPAAHRLAAARAGKTRGASLDPSDRRALRHADATAAYQHPLVLETLPSSIMVPSKEELARRATFTNPLPVMSSEECTAAALAFETLP